MHGEPCVHVPDDGRDCEPLREQKTLFVVCRGRAQVGIQFSAEIFSCSRWDTRLCGLWALLLSFPCATSLRYSCRPLLLREKVSLLLQLAGTLGAIYPALRPCGHCFGPDTPSCTAKPGDGKGTWAKGGSFQQDWCPKWLCRLCPSG